jgi:hypothetical protein
MKRTTIALAVALISTPAYATNDKPAPTPTNNAVAHGGKGGEAVAFGGKGGNSVAHGGNASSSSVAFGGDSSSASQAGAKSTSTQGQLQGQSAVGGNQSQGQTASNTGNSQDVNIVYPSQQTITHNGRTQIANVPNVSLANMWPTATCVHTSTLGVSGVGFGVAGGTSWVDQECRKLEAARQAPTELDRMYVWCTAEAAKGSPSCKQFEKAEAKPEAKLNESKFGQPIGFKLPTEYTTEAAW